MKPTKEQIAEARAWFGDNLMRSFERGGLHGTAKHIRTLLAATEEPSEEELAEEAIAFHPRPNPEVYDVFAKCFAEAAWRAYLAGARREGRR